MAEISAGVAHVEVTIRYSAWAFLRSRVDLGPQVTPEQIVDLTNDLVVSDVCPTSAGISAAGGEPVTEPVVPLFVPPVVLPRSEPRPQSFAVVPKPTDAGRFQLAIARIDHSGRVGDRSLIDGLGWQAGDRHEVRTLADGVLVFLADSGRFSLNARRHVFVPASVRGPLNLPAGARVLLVADLRRRALALYPTGVVAALLAARPVKDGEVRDAD